MVKDSVHIRIRHIRESAGLSHAAMAEELGIGRTTYINFETGKTKLFGSVFSSFIEYFNLSESDVLSSLSSAPGILEEKQNFEEIKHTLIDDYEKRLDSLRDRCDALERKITKDEEIINSLTRINDYLISQLHKND